MGGLQELQIQIEKKRLELDNSLLTDDFSIYYAKSVELDKLIEQYIEMTEGVTTT